MGTSTMRGGKPKNTYCLPSTRSQMIPGKLMRNKCDLLTFYSVSIGATKETITFSGI